MAKSATMTDINSKNSNSTPQKPFGPPGPVLNAKAEGATYTRTALDVDSAIAAAEKGTGEHDENS